MSVYFRRFKDGFTLVELSIVLVIIGLLVGGVMGGRQLLQGAQLRGQIAQIEQYKLAAMEFKSKYTYYPGDFPKQDALAMNFYRDQNPYKTGCDTYAASGCGNGDSYIGFNTGDTQSWQNGEPRLFWLDLIKAGLVNAKLEIYSDANTDSKEANRYLPAAKYDTNVVYVWSGGVDPSVWCANGSALDGQNYFGIVRADRYVGYNSGSFKYNTPTIPVFAAYSIDAKMDDGLPQYGNVMAVYTRYIPGGVIRSAWVGVSTGTPNGNFCGGPTTMATPASDTTCYDNNNTAGEKQVYSNRTNGGAGLNCALSFRIQ